MIAFLVFRCGLSLTEAGALTLLQAQNLIEEYRDLKSPPNERMDAPPPESSEGVLLDTLYSAVKARMQSGEEGSIVP